MKKYVAAFFLCFLALISEFSRAEICATSSAQLKAHMGFQSFLEFIGDVERRGLLNQTEGSFIWMDSSGETMSVTLFSSGFFDLFPIRRQSELKVCVAEDGVLFVEVFGQRHPMKFHEGQMALGSGGPKYTFKLAEMPSKLRALHKDFNP